MDNRISWQTDCTFYADADKNVRTSDVSFYLTDDIVFHISAADYHDSFEALDVLYTDPVLADDVLAFLEGRLEKVKRANPFRAFGKQTLLCLELDGKPDKYLKIKAGEFKQILSIARAKQKYSRELANRHN